MPYHSMPCGQPPLKRPYGHLKGSHPQHRWPMAVSLPPWIPYARRPWLQFAAGAAMKPIMTGNFPWSFSNFESGEGWLNGVGGGREGRGYLAFKYEEFVTDSFFSPISLPYSLTALQRPSSTPLNTPCRTPMVDGRYRFGKEGGKKR
jgi:hypothetical protein